MNAYHPMHITINFIVLLEMLLLERKGFLVFPCCKTRGPFQTRDFEQSLHLEDKYNNEATANNWNIFQGSIVSLI